MSNSMGGDRLQEYMSGIPVVTKLLVCINAAVHLVIFLTDFPQHALAINPVLVLAGGDYYRLVSAAFVHGGVLHIIMNMSSLLALGSLLEQKLGSLPFFVLTLLTVMLTGCTFILIVWLYSILTFTPQALNNSAVGYSGVLFCYALIESFHSTATTRSVFGFFSVPTRWYPLILLVVLQVVLPNISMFGHLSGLLVGLLLISKIGSNFFLPSHECFLYLEQLSCASCITRLGSYHPVQQFTLEHASLQIRCYQGGSQAGGADSGLVYSLRNACLAAAAVASGLPRQLLGLLTAVCHIIGVPADRTEICFESMIDRCSVVTQTLCPCLSDPNADSNESSNGEEHLELLEQSHDSPSATNVWNSNHFTLRGASASITSDGEAKVARAVLEV